VHPLYIYIYTHVYIQERARALELCGGDERITAGRLPEMLSLAAAVTADRATTTTRECDFAEIFSGPSFYRTCNAT
jgi:hypothetical protein